MNLLVTLYQPGIPSMSGFFIFMIYSDIKFRGWDGKEMFFWSIYFTNEKIQQRLDYPPPFEIMKFTGMKDVLNKDVFESDIISYDYHSGNGVNKYTSQVFWGDYGWETEKHTFNSIKMQGF